MIRSTLLVLLMVLAGCSNTPLSTHVVSEKSQQIVPDTTYIWMPDGNGGMYMMPIVSSRTAYYLFAADGYSVEVDPQTYESSTVGSPVASHWRHK